MDLLLLIVERDDPYVGKIVEMLFEILEKELE